MTSMSKILRPRKVQERAEVSDDDFKLRYSLILLT